MHGSEPETRTVDRLYHWNITMMTAGLDQESTGALDSPPVKGENWLRSFCQRHPRVAIKTFFDDVACDGVGQFDENEGIIPREQSSRTQSIIQRSSVFSVWRPTSDESIRKMMTGQGTGKGLDIKGKSAKRGILSGYVPFMQIHENGHKWKIRTLPRDGRICIFYEIRVARDYAYNNLSKVMEDMMEATDNVISILTRTHGTLKDDLAQDKDKAITNILSTFRPWTLGSRDLVGEEKRKYRIINEWYRSDPNIIIINDCRPSFGLDVPQRLFWEAYVMRAKDIGREPGSIYETGRKSLVAFQDMNFAAIKNDCELESPHVVVWQYTDPYRPPDEPEPDPMMPQTLLMAYEESGRVMPVVSDFDCLLVGTRWVQFRNSLPEDQVDLVHEMISDIERILKKGKEEKSKSWTASWLNVMKEKKSHITMPKNGFGCPKSYAIMKHAVQRLKEFGAVWHGAECFNFYFPQELDDDFFVVRGTGSCLPIPQYKYMKLNELQDFLSNSIDLGFTFPLNPKWVLYDSGWKAIWDKLTNSNQPYVQLSINAWYPSGSGLIERIEDVHRKYPEGFNNDQSAGEMGTQAWDEAELALEKYKRIQRAKRKLHCFLCFISVLHEVHEKVQARHALVKSSQEEEKGAGPNNGTGGGVAG